MGDSKGAKGTRANTMWSSARPSCGGRGHCTAKPAAAGAVNKAGPGHLVEASLSIACVAAGFWSAEESRCLKMEMSCISG